jgi:hypothetical protein
MTKKTAVPPMPDWLQFVADASSIKAKDFANALCIKRTVFDERVRSGEIPSADWRAAQSGPYAPTRMWRGSTVKRYFNDHQG